MLFDILRPIVLGQVIVNNKFFFRQVGYFYSAVYTGPKKCLQSSSKSNIIICNLVSKNSKALQ